jgi:hypothetical protein
MRRTFRMAPNSALPELRWARRLWPGQISTLLLRQLNQLIVLQQMSVLAGDLAIIAGKWYVTHSGLLRLSTRRRCHGIRTQAVLEFCDANAGRWTFRAIVFKNKSCHGFIGYGDADPSNVSPLVHGAEMRVAETRAVNRALRKAYGIGICSVEEIGSFAGPVPAHREPKQTGKLPPQTVSGNGSGSHGHNGNGNGSRVRDRLCQLIRQHQLDANLVKSYATDFCGTKTLREATREQVESFVVHLADWAEKDRNALLCQLNSYSRSEAGAA